MAHSNMKINASSRCDDQVPVLYFYVPTWNINRQSDRMFCRFFRSFSFK